jgi:hypothetical protein
MEGGYLTPLESIDTKTKRREILSFQEICKYVDYKDADWLCGFCKRKQVKFYQDV